MLIKNESPGFEMQPAPRIVSELHRSLLASYRVSIFWRSGVSWVPASPAD